MEGEDQATPQREMTYGEKMVGLTFNPDGDEKVDKVKKLFAEIIDTMNEPADRDTTQMRDEFHKTANEQAVIAQMCAVKFITCKY